MQRDSICSVEDCANPIEARGWCRAHYKRWRKYGSTETNRLTWRHFDMVRAMERANTRHLSVAELADAASLAPGSVVAYISYLRREFGYTVIEGTPTLGYRIGEWPGREVPRDGRRQGIRREIQRERKRPVFDSSEGVIVTAAGKALGL